MKQSRLHLPILTLLLVSLTIILWKSPRSARMAAVESLPESVVLPAETQNLEIPTETPKVMESAQVVEPAEAPIPPEPEKIESITAVIDSVDPMKSADIARAVRYLRKLPPEQVTSYLMQSLRQIGSEHPFERDRLLMVANSLQSKTDLPFWEDLIKRQTPRYADEEKVRNPPHPTFESRFIDMEQLQAIRNIGLIARDERAARRLLMEIILTADQSVWRTLHREQAYIALKETDLSASLRVLKQLAAEDELLKRL